MKLRELMRDGKTLGEVRIFKGRLNEVNDAGSSIVLKKRWQQIAFPGVITRPTPNIFHSANLD